VFGILPKLGIGKSGGIGLSRKCGYKKTALPVCSGPQLSCLREPEHLV
jgi:hypothetical protein